VPILLMACGTDQCPSLPTGVSISTCPSPQSRLPWSSCKFLAQNSICFSHADGNRLCLSFLKKQDALGARKDDNRSLFQKLIQMDWVATALAMSATVCIRCVVVISIR
jgi:hypothetical protein